MLLRRARLNPKLFVPQVLQQLEGTSVGKAGAFCDSQGKPLAAVIAAVLRQAGGREAKERALRHALQDELLALKQYLAFLGTVANTAPFVGLLGTVAGIIKAFRDIAMNVGGGPEVVSAGIAEALITTAFGLVVAIPAVFGFNYCVNKVDVLADEMEWGAHEVIDKLLPGGE
jgi:biopolymer transport protein ExbB/biopolymer transport protein TolQ